MKSNRLLNLAILTAALCLSLLLAVGMAQVLDISKVPGAKVVVQISENTAQGQYNDSLYYTWAEWAKLTQKDLDTAKTARVNAWVAFVVAQSKLPPVVPTRAELEARKAELQKQIDDIDLQLKTIKVIEK